MTPDPSARYHRLQLALMLVALAVDGMYLGGMAWAGGGRWLAALARRWSEFWFIEVAMVAALLGLFHAVATFPLTWTR